MLFEVFLVFLRLGCISFGGPVAHLGYFQEELVVRRRWCDAGTYAEIVALAQTLPGPGSSQTGFAMGVLRAGWAGGLVAWAGFTLPSTVLMLAFALGNHLFAGRLGMAAIHGLELMAVAVVAQAVLAMQRSLAPDRLRATLAAAAAGIALLAPPAAGSLLAVLFGAVAGVILLGTNNREDARPIRMEQSSLKAGVVSPICAAVFVCLLFVLPYLAAATANPLLRVLSAFYRSGSLVFGGGHVVLPMLETTVVAPGWVAQSTFLSGYGAAQALPGPLFTFAAFLGASIPQTGNRLLAGLAAVAGIFVPGLLLMAAVLPVWTRLRANQPAQAALEGVNAAVVGLLFAALYTPLCTSTIHRSLELCVALFAAVLLIAWKLPPWLVAASTVVVSVGLALVS